VLLEAYRYEKGKNRRRPVFFSDLQTIHQGENEEILGSLVDHNREGVEPILSPAKDQRRIEKKYIEQFF
jgi:hypothetical protein